VLQVGFSLHGYIELQFNNILKNYDIVFAAI